MRAAPYRSESPHCCACRAPLDEDHHFSFDGQPICYECFMQQRPPLPPADPTRLTVTAPAGFALHLRRGAWWLHGAGLPGLVGLGALGSGLLALFASPAGAGLLLSLGVSCGVVGWHRARRQFA